MTEPEPTTEVAESGRSSCRLLDLYLPVWEAGRTDSIWTPAPTGRAYRAVMDLRIAEIPIFRRLMLLRMLPGRLAGRRYDIDFAGGFVEGFCRIGFVPLGERPGRELAIGGVGRFWRPLGFHPLAPLADAEDFRTFQRPGWTRAAFDVRVHPEGGGSRISSEIRMAGTDPASARRFRRYWRLIRFPSGWIRRSALRTLGRKLGSVV